MPSFALEAAILSDLLRKGHPWVWTAEANRAWEKLKDILTNAPLLARVDFSKPFFLSTDWSPRAIGAVLLQRVFSANGDIASEGVIGYASRKLTDAERNYSATEGECLAVVFGIKFFRSYLYGMHFTVETDHVALKWLMNDREVQGRLARWALKIMCYNFVIVYKRGVHHKTADALSRLERHNASFYLRQLLTLESLREERLPSAILQILCAHTGNQPEDPSFGGEEEGAEVARWWAYQQKVQGPRLQHVDLQQEYLKVEEGDDVGVQIVREPVTKPGPTVSTRTEESLEHGRLRVKCNVGKVIACDTKRGQDPDPLM